MSPVPESLLLEDLRGVWESVRRHVDGRSADAYGSIATPDLSVEAELSLRSLLSGSTGRRVDIAKLERALVALGVGDDLDDALTQLGAPPSQAVVQRRLAVERRRTVVDAVTSDVARWSETWASDWILGVVRSGQFADLDADEALDLIRSVRRVLDHRTEANEFDDGQMARTDVAARLFGDAHALDDGTPVERVTRRALACALDAPLEVDGRALWTRAGFATDGVSAPVLTWNLLLEPDSEIGALTHAATAAASPVHLSRFLLQRHPIRVAATSLVLLVENPRIVEAAAERSSSLSVVCTNGNPSGAVTVLIMALIEAKVEVRHHGDFDAAGIAIVRRLAELGCRPWKMSADDYRAAVTLARHRGIALPTDARRCGPTPWDPLLESTFDASRSIVHEELLIDELLDSSTW